MQINDDAVRWLLLESYEKEFFIEVELYPIFTEDGSPISQPTAITGYPIALYNNSLIMLSFFITTEGKNRQVTHTKTNIHYSEISRIKSPIPLNPEFKEAVEKYLNTARGLFGLNETTSQLKTIKEMFDYTFEYNTNNESDYKAVVPENTLKKFKKIKK